MGGQLEERFINIEEELSNCNFCNSDSKVVNKLYSMYDDLRTENFILKKRLERIKSCLSLNLSDLSE